MREIHQKEIVTSIIKGIRKGKNYNNALDYQPGNSLLLNNNKELINEMDKIKTIINNCFFYKTNTVKKSKIHL